MAKTGKDTISNVETSLAESGSSEIPNYQQVGGAKRKIPIIPVGD
jgi:hypothetical protein